MGVFALFHGHAHGGELGAAGALQLGLGFLVATAVLHGAGPPLGLCVTRLGPLLARLPDRTRPVMTVFFGRIGGWSKPDTTKNGAR